MEFVATWRNSADNLVLHLQDVPFWSDPLRPPGKNLKSGLTPYVLKTTTRSVEDGIPTRSMGTSKATGRNESTCDTVIRGLIAWESSVLRVCSMVTRQGDWLVSSAKTSSPG
jgi:hypothetical protein